MEFPAIGIETSSRLSRDEEIQLRHALVQIAADQKGQEQWVKVASPVGVSAGESRHVHIAKVVPGGRAVGMGHGSGSSVLCTCDAFHASCAVRPPHAGGGHSRHSGTSHSHFVFRVL